MRTEYERQLNDCSTEISNIKSWINANTLDSNIRYLVAYSVVKASGTIEIVFKQMMYDALSDGAKEEAQTFLEKSIIDSSCNPNTGNISKMLEKSDSSRKALFDNIVKGKQEKSDLNSLVNLRNDIAHGRTISTSINTIERYFQSGRWILQELENLLFSVTTT